jgi:hypothetical protein
VGESSRARPLRREELEARIGPLLARRTHAPVLPPAIVEPSILMLVAGAMPVSAPASCVRARGAAVGGRCRCVWLSDACAAAPAPSIAALPGRPSLHAAPPQQHTHTHTWHGLVHGILAKRARRIDATAADEQRRRRAEEQGLEVAGACHFAFVCSCV